MDRRTLLKTFPALGLATTLGLPESKALPDYQPGGCPDGTGIQGYWIDVQTRHAIGLSDRGWVLSSKLADNLRETYRGMASEVRVISNVALAFWGRPETSFTPKGLLQLNPEELEGALHLLPDLNESKRVREWLDRNLETDWSSWAGEDLLLVYSVSLTYRTNVPGIHLTNWEGAL